jgi:hypothetical protein
MQQIVDQAKKLEKFLIRHPDITESILGNCPLSIEVHKILDQIKRISKENADL